jgi:5-methylthioribose kinase
LFELAAANAPEYLTGRGLPVPRRVTELGGGVSNTVLLVEGAGGRFILKQALGKLRVQQEWFSDRRRIFREAAGLRAAAACLPRGSAPKVLWEDRENCAFAMEAAPEGAPTWKAQLMAGRVEASTAARVGGMLAALVRGTWGEAECEREFGDQTVFDELRLDPYYRSTAARHADLAGHFARLMEESARRRWALTHGDWSPKNFLVDGQRVVAIDFEVVHYGDPSFDAAFLLNHLLLKGWRWPAYRGELRAAAEAFWRSYQEGLPAGAEWVEAATLGHLGALMLARVDGKSPAEYLDTAELRARVRSCARELVSSRPGSVEEAFGRVW